VTDRLHSVATHEAGHAICARKIVGGPIEVWLEPVGADWQGRCSHPTARSMGGEMAIVLAGTVAQLLDAGVPMLERMVEDCLWSERREDLRRAAAVDERLRRDALEEAQATCQVHWGAITALAERLTKPPHRARFAKGAWK
jgi:hypothetical protein